MLRILPLMAAEQVVREVRAYTNRATRKGKGGRGYNRPNPRFQVALSAERQMSWSKDQRMAHDYVSNSSSSGAEKPAEHPARAIMAKRWEERRAEARAKRVAELKLGDSGLIALASLAGPPAADSGEVSAVEEAAAPSSAPADDATAHGFKKGQHTPSRPAPAPLPPQPLAAAAAYPAPSSQGQALTTTPGWLRDSRKAMLIVAVLSNGLLLALLYFGGFLG